MDPGEELRRATKGSILEPISPKTAPKWGSFFATRKMAKLVYCRSKSQVRELPKWMLFWVPLGNPFWNHLVRGFGPLLGHLGWPWVSRRFPKGVPKISHVCHMCTHVRHLEHTGATSGSKGPSRQGSGAVLGPLEWLKFILRSLFGLHLECSTLYWIGFHF